MNKNSVYKTPESNLEPSHNTEQTQRFMRIARRQKSLLLAFLIYFTVSIFVAKADPEIQTLLHIAQVLIMLGIVILTARLSFCLYNKYGAIFLTILSIIPLINIIIILVASSKATKTLKDNGFRVGLLGADINAIKKWL